MVRVEFAENTGHGPLPSGSAVVQVRLMVCDDDEAGVNVVLRLVAVPKAPEPGGALHVPVPLEVADTGTGLAPHVEKGPRTDAVAAAFTFTVTTAELAVSHPLPAALTVA
jgi:hypothetical protein